MFPFERLTAIMQTNIGLSFSAQLSLLQDGGYYTGVETTIIAQLLTAQVFFFSHTYFKSTITKILKENIRTDFINSLSAAFVTAIVTNPVWLINSRVMLKKRRSNSVFKAIYDELTVLLSNEGGIGLFRGVFSAMGTVEFSLQYMKECKPLMDKS
jgi:hypothetical protein